VHCWSRRPSDGNFGRRLSSAGCAPCRSRSRQCDGQRIAAQHHHQYQPPYRPLTISFGAKTLGVVADGASSRSTWRLLAPKATRSALRSASAAPSRSGLRRKHLTGFALSFDGRESSGGPGALGRFLNCRIDPAQTAIEVSNSVGLNLDSVSEISCD
jgi:hypothetical protein